MLNNHKIIKQLYTNLLLLVLWMYVIGFVKLLLFPSLDVLYSNLITGLGFVLLLIFIWYKSQDRRALFRGLGLSLIIAAFTFLLSSFIYDFSFDGQGYHQNAIVQMANGWNYVHEFSSDAFHDRWIDHYPKAAWLVSSNYMQLLGNLEAAKAINLLLILASFFMGLKALPLLGLQKNWMVILMSGLLAFDPINLNSFLSFTNDGLVSSGMLICSYLLLIEWNNPSRSNWLLLALTSIFSINIKFNALVYIAIIFAVYFLFVLIYRRDWKITLSKLGLIFIIGVAVFGYNPYIKHTLTGLHPFHPIMQYEAQADLGSDYMPSNFRDKSTFSRLVISSFSKTSFSKSFGEELPLKFPFGLSRQEIETYAANGVMIGGLGPWFSGAVLLSFLMLLWSLISFRPLSSFNRNIILVIITIMIATWINPLSWWFRTVPQYYFIAPLAVIMAIRSQSNSLKKAGKVLLGILVINSCLMGAYIMYQPWASIRLKAELKEIKLNQKASNKDMIISFGQHADSFKNKLDLYEINYVEKEQVSCENPISFKLNEVRICTE